MYLEAEQKPEEFIRVAAIAMKYKLINNVFSVTDANIASYMATLNTAIVNQTSYDDVQKLTLPITLVHGRLDPVVVPTNLTYLARTMPQVTLRHVVAGHEIIGPMIPVVVQAITTQLTAERS